MRDYRLIVRSFGGPEVIETEPVVPGPVAPGMVRVRHTAIGVNFIDTYNRSGLYPLPLPAGLGIEAAGVIEVLGPGVTGVEIGRRVAYMASTPGTYATVNDVPADKLLMLPDGVSEEIAAAVLLKGLTAQALIVGCAKIEAGQTALVLAAAGGTGRLLVQWMATLGVRVIAHAGSQEKADVAKALGADLALHCPFDELAAKVREATAGMGVDTVFDGVGAASWEASLDSLKRRGLMISFGNASGAVPAFRPLELSRRGSLFMTRPTMGDYVTGHEELTAAAASLFAMIAAGKLDIEIGLKRPLADAAEVHRLLESRQTTGSVILVP